MFTIHSWNEAFVVLRKRAEEVRGFIELNPGRQPRERWPRTTGADVVAIAALLDQHVQGLHSSHGVHGVYRRWRACLGDIEQYALTEPGDTFSENRVFWRCLAALFVHLSSVGAPLPDPMTWTVLMNELGQVLAIRNVGPKGDGPFKHFENVKTFDDLYREQYKFLRDTRGSDELAPEKDPNAAYGKGGTTYKIPRTTNADVVQLTDYWSKQLAGVKRVMGHDSVVQRWNVVRGDVDAIARKGDPNALYPKNNGFWREVKNTAIHVAVADEAPTKWDMALDSLKDSVKQLPDRIVSGAKTVATGVADAAGDLAQGVGKIANRAGQGLFSGLGVPLLAGGGLLGVFLISRSRKKTES